LRIESPLFDAMGGVHEPVEDADSQRGIADLFVTARDRQLRGRYRSLLISQSCLPRPKLTFRVHCCDDQSIHAVRHRTR
jgi:anthranilate/para-aminobenzoate synthase component II